MTGDILGGFADEVARSRGRVKRLTIVSPWVTYGTSGSVLERLLERAERDDAAVLLVTRPSTCPSHVEAIDAVRRAPRGRVQLNDRLHAKLYLCDQGAGRGFAVIGSANLTSSSRGLDEIAVLIRAMPGSRMISQVAPAAERLAGRRAGRHRSRRTQRRRSS